MSDTVRSTHENSFLLFDANISQVHHGYGLNAFDFSRRLTSENRAAVIDILLRLGMLIGSKEDGEEECAQSWEVLRENVMALKSSEDAQCAANIFNNLRFLAPPSEIREIHR
ncbi:Uncharacterised protein [uncultured archaeon]|nr:Uncharacterised protein [uncultured archaeon]